MENSSNLETTIWLRYQLFWIGKRQKGRHLQRQRPTLPLNHTALQMLENRTNMLQLGQWTRHINHVAVAEQSSHSCQRKHRPNYHIHTYIRTYIHTHTHTYLDTYIRQWLLLCSRVINVHHCKNNTPTIISIQKSTQTYKQAYKHTYINTYYIHT